MSGDKYDLDMVLDFYLMSLWEKGGVFPNEGVAFQEGIAKAAEWRGMTVSEYRGLMAKWVEFDQMLTEFMRAYGVEVSDRYSAVHLLQAGQTIQTARSSAGEVTAQIRKAKMAEAAQMAARLWDIMTTIPEHTRAARIAERLGVSEPTARKYLRETGRKTKRR